MMTDKWLKRVFFLCFFVVLVLWCRACFAANTLEKVDSCNTTDLEAIAGQTATDLDKVAGLDFSACSPCSAFSTEELAWNGDYDADCGSSPTEEESRTACTSDGGSTEAGTLDAGAEIGSDTGGDPNHQPATADGNYLRLYGDNGSLYFNAINGSDEIGYVDCNVYIVNDGTDSTCVVFETQEHTDQKVICIVTQLRKGQIIHQSTGNGDPINQSTVSFFSTNTVKEDGWYNFKFAWDINAGVGASHYLGIKVNDNDWEYSDSQIYAWADGEEPDGTFWGEKIGGAGNDVYFLDACRFWLSNDGT